MLARPQFPWPGEPAGRAVTQKSGVVGVPARSDGRAARDRRELFGHPFQEPGVAPAADEADE